VSPIEFRDLAGIDDFLAAEVLQREVWGAGDKEDPADLMMVIQHEGGLVAGAFDGGRLVGYVFGFPTRESGVQHSHRLAVHPSARGAGLALRLKRYQRDWCLARGIRLVRWTFDPLRHTNAHLNIGRLGAEVGNYYADYYGEMKGINAGLPSDRLLAVWRLDAPHVRELAAGQSIPPAGGALSGTVAVAIPADIDALLMDDPPAALAERQRVREALTSLFENGYRVRSYAPQQRSYFLARDD